MGRRRDGTAPALAAELTLVLSMNMEDVLVDIAREPGRHEAFRFFQVGVPIYPVWTERRPYLPAPFRTPWREGAAGPAVDDGDGDDDDDDGAPPLRSMPAEEQKQSLLDYALWAMMGFEGTYVGVAWAGNAAAGPAMPHEAVYVLPPPWLMDGANPALAQMIRRIMPTCLAVPVFPVAV